MVWQRETDGDPHWVVESAMTTAGPRSSDEADITNFADAILLGDKDRPATSVTSTMAKRIERELQQPRAEMQVWVKQVDDEIQREARALLGIDE